MKSRILSSLQSCLAHDRHSNARLIIVISEGNSSVYLTKVHDEKTVSLLKPFSCSGGSFCLCLLK